MNLEETKSEIEYLQEKNSEKFVKIEKANKLLGTLNEIIEFVEQRKEEIENDPRMKGEPVNVDINAPLALVQCNMEGQLNILNSILNKFIDEGDNDG